ncbi:MAG: HlyD family type I secretion periplasmic adaptor subunit [Gammaproteobacteria bacterium]|nr:MAG: HlyD family type I secretion periplasmic adaptor subunit [Gammaproteobacteria bacterium]RLA19376.1 MAG: HlyD family type I secretion periplasmic adaptor subunit [Gammaproteobacteria bacterium]
MRPIQPQQEHEFLPAALEVQETPPSPIGRTISWVIMLFFITAVGWATWGEIDIIVASQGRIIASGHTKIIQPLEIGIVKKIYVEEGQMVSEGDRLVELESDKAMADKQRIEDELITLAQEIIRLQRLVDWVDSVVDDEPLSSEEKTMAALSNLQRQLLFSQWNEFRSRITTLKHEKKKHRSERNSINQQVKKYQAILPIVRSRAAKMKRLNKKSFVSEEEYLEMEQQRLEMVHDLKASQQQSLELQAAVQEVDSQIEQVKKQFKSRMLVGLQESQQRQKALEQEKIKAATHLKAQLLKAPVSGVVQQLVIHTEGGVVTSAQQLMVIVPIQAGLEVEAMVANKDIGFIEEGQQAEVKIDAFPFTKYGLIDGTLAHLSNDAIADEELGMVYKAQVKLKKSHIQVEGRQVNLSPGMTVVVEIKTGKRRVIEYFLSPLLRYKQESIRER